MPRAEHPPLPDDSGPRWSGVVALVCVLALVVGTLVGTAGVSAMALASSQQGQPAMVMLRGLFGGRLSYVPTVFNMIQLLGWGTFEIVTTTMAARTLWPELPRWPIVVVIGAVYIDQLRNRR